MNEKIIIEVDKINFAERYVTSVFGIGFIFLFFMVILGITINILTGIITLLFLVYYLYEKYKESLIYTTKIIYNTKKKRITIFFGKKNNYDFEKSISVSNLKSEWFNNNKGFESSKIIFYNNNKVFFIQYVNGDWTTDKIKNIELKINQLPDGGHGSD